MSLRMRRRQRPYINIVPLIDVLTLLIFFFLMSMQFRQITALHITPPKVETADKIGPQQRLTVGVSRDGQFSFEGHIIAAADLYPTLQRRVKDHSAEEVLISADENAPLKYLTQAMDDCRKAGLTNSIKLQVNP